MLVCMHLVRFVECMGTACRNSPVHTQKVVLNKCRKWSIHAPYGHTISEDDCQGELCAIRFTVIEFDGISSNIFFGNCC